VVKCEGAGTHASPPQVCATPQPLWLPYYYHWRPLSARMAMHWYAQKAHTPAADSHPYLELLLLVVVPPRDSSCCSPSPLQPNDLQVVSLVI
jgi:hypothetical protein